jgi:hypothetical protein
MGSRRTAQGRDLRTEGEKVGRWEKAEGGEKGFGTRRRPIGLDCDAAKNADFGFIDKCLDFQWCGRRAFLGSPHPSRSV